MMLEQTGSGLESELKISGFGRFIPAAFLAFWLLGWGAGEVFALGMLAAGAWSLFTGRPLGSGHPPVTPGAALPIGLFLLFWLALWTFGGLAAGREMLRLLFGRDRLLVRNDYLEVEHGFGLFRLRERVPREEIRGFYPTSAGAALAVETTHGPMVLTRLGTTAERAELEQSLNKEFNVAAQPASVGGLPKGWCEELSLEHDPVLIKDPAARRKQARTAWILCALLSLLPLYLLAADRERADFIRAVIFSLLLLIAMAAGAYWLSFVRKEWRLDKGRFVLQRRFGQNRTQLFEASSLELVENNSSEGGPTYSLQAVAPGAPPPTGWQRTGRFRRTVYSQSDDPTEPRNYGLWLNQRCQVPFADLTTIEAKAKDLEELKNKLATSGRLGRVSLRLVELAEKHQRGT